MELAQHGKFPSHPIITVEVTVIWIATIFYIALVLCFLRWNREGVWCCTQFCQPDLPGFVPQHWHTLAWLRLCPGGKDCGNSENWTEIFAGDWGMGNLSVFSKNLLTGWVFQDRVDCRERKIFDCLWEGYFPCLGCLCFKKWYHHRLGISAYNFWRRPLVIIYQSFKWTWNQGDKMNNSP